MLLFKILISFFVFISFSRGESDVFLFKNISVKDGLSESTINVILEDHNGFIYFGTDNGLDFYDGYSFRSYYTNSFDQNSMLGSKVNLIYEDSKDMIWIGTDLGISKLNPFKNTFVRPSKINDLGSDYLAKLETIIETRDNKFILKSSFNNSIYVFDSIKDTTICINCDTGNIFNYKIINDLFFDDNLLWMGTDKGLFYFNKDLSKIEKFKSLKKLINADIRVIEKGVEGNIWLGSDSGLGLIENGINGKVREYQKGIDSTTIVSNRINDLEWDNIKNQLWVSTKDGLSLLNQIDNIFTNFVLTPFSESIIENNVEDILISEKSGKLWFKTKNHPGINCLVRWYNDDIQSYESQFNHLEHDIIDPTSLSDNNVSTFIEDMAGNIWIGTYGNGISFYSNNKSKFSSIRYDQENEWGLKDDKIYSITTLSYGDMMWVANDFGLELISSEGSREYEYGKSTLKINYINDVENINDHYLWIATDKGILRVNSNNDEIIRFSYNKNIIPINQILDDLVYDLEISGNGDIWAGTASGLVIIDTTELLSKNFTTEMSIRVIKEDTQGNIWIGTDSDGLFVLDENQINEALKGNDFEAEAHIFDQNFSKGISSSKITCITEDDKGYIWVGTDIGLNRFNKDQENFTHFFVQDGLPSNFITGIENDSENNLWISTKNGMSIFNQLDSTFINYNFNDGIDNIDFYSNSSDKSLDGSLYFGGPKGITVINLKSMNFNEYQPKCIITQINKTTFDDIITEDYLYISDGSNLIPEIKINHYIKSFTINFVALNYHKTASNKYRYRLQNLDKDWVQSDGLRFASYNNLGRGAYKFEVQGSNNDDVWSNSSYLNIKFIPHPLLSLGAFVVYFIFLFIGLYMFFRYRIQKQKHQLEENRKSEELEKARDFQMSLIPQNAPDYPGYEFAFYMKTSTEVGGDYYDFFPQDDGSLYVVVGDATGHGLNAGMMVSITKAGLHGSIFTKPSIITSRLNQTIKSIDLGTTRMSLNMTRIEGEKLEFTSAGMPPGYIFKNKKNTSEELLVPGLPLGSMKNLKFQSSSFNLKKGDAFVLISDGLPECVNPKGEMLDYLAVEDCVKKNGDNNAQGIIDSLVDLGESWMNGRMNDDDITLVVIKKI